MTIVALPSMWFPVHGLSAFPWESQGPLIRIRKTGRRTYEEKTLKSA